MLATLYNQTTSLDSRLTVLQHQSATDVLSPVMHDAISDAVRAEVSRTNSFCIITNHPTDTYSMQMDQSTSIHSGQKSKQLMMLLPYTLFCPSILLV